MQYYYSCLSEEPLTAWMLEEEMLMGLHYKHRGK